MEQELADWMIENLPPEAGPYLSWVAANFDVMRPGLIVLAASVVVVQVVLVWYAWRFLSSDKSW